MNNNTDKNWFYGEFNSDKSIANRPPPVTDQWPARFARGDLLGPCFFQSTSSRRLTTSEIQSLRLGIACRQSLVEKAEYGSQLLDRLSRDFKLRYGKGFSRRNVLDMRRFYLTYQKWQTVSAKLTWSHYTLLLSVSEELPRKFYERQCLQEGWSVRELKRQIDSLLFERIVLSKDKKSTLKLAQKGQVISKADDVVKDPYVFEFLGLPEEHSEKELEQRITDNLRLFLLELGKGFTFVVWGE